MEIEIDEREIPPNILKTPVIENNLFYTETRDDRETLFVKSYISFKKKISGKLQENERVFERRINAVVENNTKKQEAVKIIDRVQSKKKILGDALKNLAIKTGNDE